MEPIIEDSVETNVQPTDKAPATSMLPALTDEEMKAVTIDQSELMKFDTLNNEEVDMTAVKPQAAVKVEYRRVPVPAHRYSPLRTNWETILKTLVKHMGLQVRMNTRRRAIEIKSSKTTKDIGAVTKAADFLKAYMLGFELQDAVAILRLEDLYMNSFDITDVKMLHGDHLSRCVGRICGEKGKTKFAIENAT